MVDINPKQAQKLANLYMAYTQLQHMLDNEPVDVVIICTPGGLLGELTCQVMRSGRHVIVEKPMEITRKAIDEMLQVQQTAEVN